MFFNQGHPPSICSFMSALSCWQIHQTITCQKTNKQINNYGCFNLAFLSFQPTDSSVTAKTGEENGRNMLAFLSTVTHHSHSNFLGQNHHTALLRSKQPRNCSPVFPIRKGDLDIGLHC